MSDIKHFAVKFQECDKINEAEKHKYCESYQNTSHIADFSYPENYIRYLGTGGARFCMASQLRQTGGIWFSYGGLKGVIDPGPGSLFHICRAVPQLPLYDIRAILLSHKHLDHSTDINVLSEAMTECGFKKQGTVALPSDALNGDDRVFLPYCAKNVGNIDVVSDGKIIELDSMVKAEPVIHRHHGVECYGFIFRKKGLPTWGVISDTKIMPHFSERYSECDYISINITFPEKKSRLEHMSLEDTADLLKTLHPKLVTISHMGVRLLEAGPEFSASRITTKETRIVAGRDGMVVDLDTVSVFCPEYEVKKETKYFLLR